MQSQVIALLVHKGSREATLLVRRGDGQYRARRYISEAACPECAAFRGQAGVAAQGPWHLANLDLGGSVRPGACLCGRIEPAQNAPVCALEPVAPLP